MVRLLTPADYRSMPWKNGGGRTTEIVSHPPEAALDVFAWRVSVAEVDRDGPFSRFPGIDRTIVLLDGEGMRLRGGTLDADLTTPFALHTFSGDEATDCTLVAGRIRDFNAMVRRGRARGSVAVVRGEGAEFAPADYRLVYAATGQHECAISGWASRVLAAGYSLLVDHTADREGSPMTIRPLAADAVALVVSIDCQ